ncbi:MAG TPA: type 1 glutamine amidotransferase domain-containing protein [Candidatus Polarisedimenticolia bacterium]|nr:type 1 glutamine amidotransferase domain-containing protein [Candidatus Polarisedimenticolia bacterium]
MSGGKVAVLVEDDYQDQEVWVPLYRLREEGYQTVVLGPKAARYTSKYGYPIVAEAAAGDQDADELSGVVIPGGWAPDRLRQDEGVLRLVRHLFEKRKVVAAICHGGWVLASAGVARGRKLTCYQAIRDDMRNAGAEYVDQEVVRDGRLITSRKPDDLPAFCREIIRALKEG